MSKDPYSTLKLPPGRYDAATLRRSFDDRREELRGQSNSRSRADELHVAYSVLRDPANQTVYLKRSDGRTPADRTDELRALIAGSLEDGLLRHSRRMRILEEGRRLGLSSFHTQLLIAQTQFGPKCVLESDATAGECDSTTPSAVARLAGLFVLALALFLAAVRAIGV